MSYSQISGRIAREFDIKISKATVLRWCRGTNNTFNRMRKVALDPSPALAYIIGAYFGTLQQPGMVTTATTSS
ncbi:hypothetical protein [Thermococcus sp.]